MLSSLTGWDDTRSPAVAIEPTESQATAVFWGATIPAIPNLVAIDQDRTGQTYENARQALIQTQQRWIDGLHGGDRFTLSLRIISSGNSNEDLTLGLVGKTEGKDEGETIVSARNFFNKIREGFPNGYNLNPCRKAEDLALLRFPFLPNGELGEFRRSINSLRSISTTDLPGLTGCQISPWNADSSDFQDLFKALLCHPTPAAIAFNLRPTQLTYDESRSIATLADSYARLASTSQSQNDSGPLGMSSGSSIQNKYLEAEQASKTWTAFQNNLNQAFELTVSIISDSPLPQSVIAALQIAVSGKPSTPELKTGSGTIVFAQSEAQKIAIRQNWVDLALYRWDDRYDLGRIPWLFSPQEVHSVFRLPIADRNGTWGLPSAAGASDARRPRYLQDQDGEIQIGALHLSRKQLTQHLLICGVPGSGKTNTSLYLLETLWREHGIPWMVLEPAKTEYRGLQSVDSLRDDLLIFSLGDERVAPFRFNPFEVPDGINLDSHMGSLLDLFSVSMSMWGPLPNVVEQLIIEAYKRKGFTILGNNQSLHPPTFSDLATLIPEIVPRLGYKKETTDEITAAIAVRINKFCRGATGRMLNTKRSFPFDEMMQRPVILEMSQMTNSDDRAFVMGLILNRCYQYWTARRHEATGELKHLLLVEEAHNLLANVSEGGSAEQANPKGKAVRNFANMLAEVRGFGQGIAIAEQNPEGLVSDVMVNTNIKLAHRIVEAKNRETLGRSMLLTSQQEKGLASLGTGQMLYYIGGNPEPSMTSAPNFKDADNGFNPRLTDAEIHQQFEVSVKGKYGDLYALPLGCPTDHSLAACLEQGTDVLQSLSENPQYKGLKQDLLLAILAAPFGLPAAQKVFAVCGRILLERGAGNLSLDRVQGVLGSALSLLALEAAQSKGQVHGWFGHQVEEAHGLLMRSLSHPTPELQAAWLELCRIPDALLQLGLPHPEYSKCVAPGAFRYENQILVHRKKEFLDQLRASQMQPWQELDLWLSQTVAYFQLLSDPLRLSLRVCFAIQMTEQNPENLVHFISY